MKTRPCLKYFVHGCGYLRLFELGKYCTIFNKIRYLIGVKCGIAYVISHNYEIIQGALSGLRQLLATENPLKMMKNAFYFTSKALFVLKIFKFLS